MGVDDTRLSPPSHPGRRALAGGRQRGPVSDPGTIASAALAFAAAAPLGFCLPVGHYYPRVAAAILAGLVAAGVGGWFGSERVGAALATALTPAWIIAFSVFGAQL